MSKIQTEIDEIVIKGVTYVPKDSLQTHQNFTGDIRIVILQRGWVYIGRFNRQGNLCTLKNAFCIRVWGTTRGLPELVNGILKNTQLDKCDGIVEFDWFTVVHTINVNEDKWKILIG